MVTVCTPAVRITPARLAMAPCSIVQRLSQQRAGQLLDQRMVAGQIDDAASHLGIEAEGAGAAQHVADFGRDFGLCRIGDVSAVQPGRDRHPRALQGVQHEIARLVRVAQRLAHGVQFQGHLLGANGVLGEAAA